MKVIKTKFSSMGKSGGDTTSKYSFAKKGKPAAGGTRPKGFAFGSGKPKA